MAIKERANERNFIGAMAFRKRTRGRFPRRIRRAKKKAPRRRFNRKKRVKRRVKRTRTANRGTSIWITQDAGKFGPNIYWPGDPGNQNVQQIIITPDPSANGDGFFTAYKSLYDEYTIVKYKLIVTPRFNPGKLANYEAVLNPMKLVSFRQPYAGAGYQTIYSSYDRAKQEPGAKTHAMGRSFSRTFAAKVCQRSSYFAGDNATTTATALLFKEAKFPWFKTQDQNVGGTNVLKPMGVNIWAPALIQDLRSAYQTISQSAPRGALDIPSTTFVADANKFGEYNQTVPRVKYSDNTYNGPQGWPLNLADPQATDKIEYDVAVKILVKFRNLTSGNAGAPA